MSDQALYRRTLQRALEIAGGQSALRGKLAVSDTNLSSWLQGSQPIPEQVFLQLVDIVVRPEPMHGIPAKPDEKAQKSKLA
jgi:hypothetical protein